MLTGTASDTRCGGCGEPLDTLRAGHVAVLGGEFVYFCGLQCKKQYLRTTASGADLPTAEPPSVSAVAAPAAPVAREAGPPIAKRIRSERRRERTLDGVDVIGMICGVLVPASELVGHAADTVRLPLALTAFAALVARLLRVGRNSADPSTWVVVAPIVGTVVAAAWGWLVADPASAGMASLAGLSCAAALGNGALVMRARLGVDRARATIERRLDVQVRVVRRDAVTNIRAAEVRAGEAVVVEAGERVGVDGVITAGEAQVEPWLDAGVHVFRREGDAIVAGARIVAGRVRVTTAWSGKERAWAKLLSNPATRIDVVAPTARAVRSAVEWGTPIFAALIGLGAFMGNASAPEIVAAMAAAGVAIASSALPSLVGLHFARGHLDALVHGIAYKDANAFERAGATELAVLSARGTVLHGEPEIVAVELVRTPSRAAERASPSAVDETSRVLALAAGAEVGYQHPLAAAILRTARAQGVAPEAVRNASVRAGLGVTAVASNGERLVVGGRAIMLEEKIGGAIADTRIGELESQGRTVLLVALGNRIVGLIALQDGLRIGARAAIQKLLDAGIEPVLLSGEARETCEAIGRSLDIDHIRPEVLPGDRGAAVRALAEGGMAVAVIGHPASDDGALGAADVSVALGAAGAAPSEWAIALAGEDIRSAAEALAIPRAARARIRKAIALGVLPAVVVLLVIGFGVAPLGVAPLSALLGAAVASLEAREYSPAASRRS